MKVPVPYVLGLAPHRLNMAEDLCVQKTSVAKILCKVVRTVI